MMKKYGAMMLAFSIVVFTAGVGRAGLKWNMVLSDYGCLEIGDFTVARGEQSTKALNRATKVDEEALARLQQKVYSEISSGKVFVPKVRLGGSKLACPERGLVLNGVITDFKRGNMTKAVLLPFAGKDVIEVHVTIKDKHTNEVLAEKTMRERGVPTSDLGLDPNAEKNLAKEVRSFAKKGN